MKKFIVDYFGEFNEINAQNLSSAFFWAKKSSYRNVYSITDESGKEFLFFELIKLQQQGKI